MLGGILIGFISFVISANPPTWREICFTLTGSIFSLAIVAIYIMPGSRKVSIHQVTEGPDNNQNDIIKTVEELRETLPPGQSGRGFDDAKKVITYLDDQMIGFIQKSPFLQLSTVGANGVPFVSPKGDQPGFVSVKKDSTRRGTSLVIPDRPGNRLLFGLQNILENPNISILFEIPGTCTTLRCGGIARISKDLRLLQDHMTRRCVPKVVIVVDVQYAFFHCAKAYMRSGLWDPTTWPSEEHLVKFGQYFCPKGSNLANKIDKNVTDHYLRVQRSIDGECGEEDD